MDISLSDHIDKVGNNIDKSYTNLIATEIVQHSLSCAIVVKSLTKSHKSFKYSKQRNTESQLDCYDCRGTILVS
ncbi:23528_t:CDS:2 [Gigaspora margarita]|uniref:23528_t:CDS:1 n=1 Tax=Gigaspora margarita TaxID=4874 RepID=A0ABM8W378_GIGMA|nr:23528_t:CDS:2 [Gigaspora margarita]